MRHPPLKWDHPRVCGEKYAFFWAATFSRGSPPRVRGKVYTRPTCSSGLRITPACAGKRAVLHGVRLRQQDHPRVCGEKPTAACAASVPRGSPPRVRGKAAGFQNPRFEDGITPACAGKSQQMSSHTATAQDHPRVCGEKSSVCETSMPLTGSPPRVRGKAI